MKDWAAMLIALGVVLAILGALSARNAACMMKLYRTLFPEMNESDQFVKRMPNDSFGLRAPPDDVATRSGSPPP